MIQNLEKVCRWGRGGQVFHQKSDAVGKGARPILAANHLHELDHTDVFLCNRDLLCMVGNWPFFFVCQMLQKVAIFFGFDVVRRGGGRWQENASCIRCILMFLVLRWISTCPRNLILWAISMRHLSSKISISSVVRSSSPKSSGSSSVSMKVKQG